MKITASPDVDRVKQEEFSRFVAIFLTQVSEATNGKLTFDENFNSKSLTVNFPVANTDVAVPHGLGRVPTNYIVAGATVAMSVYDGASANTPQLLYLRSDAIGACRLVVY